MDFVSMAITRPRCDPEASSLRETVMLTLAKVSKVGSFRPAASLRSS